MKVLIAESHGERRAQLAHCVRAWGHTVTAVADGRAAWTAWEEDAHRLVIAESDLPKLAGTDLCRRVQRAARDAVHHVMLLVSKQTQDDLRRALESGADDVLVRPVDEDELALRILIAERRIAERRRTRDEHHSFMDLLAQAPDLIQTVALDGQLLYVNRAWCEALGHAERDIGGMSFFDLVVPEQRSAMRKAFRWVRRGRGLRKMQTELRTRDGRTLSVEGSLTPRFRGKVPTSVRVILHDVSRRTRAETVLRNVLEGTSATTGRDFYRSLVRHLSGALGVRHAVVAEIIPGGTSRLRTLAIWSGERFTPNRVIRLEQGTDPLFPGTRFLSGLGVASYLGVPVQGGDGRAVGLLCVLDDGPMRSGPEALRILATFAQRAGAELERQRAEAARRTLDRHIQESQKLESMGVMAGGIAHDFNNLLTSIMGYASLAARNATPGTPVARYLADIEQASRRAADLAMQMLAYSGKGQFVIEPLDLRAIVAETMRLLRTDITGRGAALECDLPAGLSAIEGDGTQIRQVVMNLLLNAAQSLEGRGGTVAVHASEVELGAAKLASCYAVGDARPGRYLALEVSDSGCGMDAATQERIFDPFFTTKPGGRGLGLAAVVGIVRGHRGALCVRSVPGEGTALTVFLPASERRVTPRPAADEPELPDAHAQILVVDDEPGVRALARDILTSGGYRVLTAEHGRAGVDAFRERGGEIDAVLLDMTMPVMGGVEAFAALRALRADVRVIVSSGYTESEAIDRFGDAAPAAFIQKPYTAGRLLRAVAKVLTSGAVTA